MLRQHGCGACCMSWDAQCIAIHARLHHGDNDNMTFNWQAHARARQKQQSAAYAVRDAERVAKWRAGAALWRSGSEGSGEEQRPQG